jgi:hypothetical protein
MLTCSDCPSGLRGTRAVPCRVLVLSKGRGVVQDSGTVYTDIAQIAERSIETDRVASVILFHSFRIPAILLEARVGGTFGATSGRHEKQPLATRDSGHRRSSLARRKRKRKGRFPFLNLASG